ncbi:MAG: ATP-binding protein [Phycisphaerales bacterium JB039]
MATGGSSGPEHRAAAEGRDDPLPVACARLDAEGRIASANRAWAALAGALPAGVGTNLPEALQQLGEAGAAEQLRIALGGTNGVVRADVSVAAPGGPRRFRLLASGAARDGASVVAIDLSDRDEDAAPVGDRRSWLSSIFDSAMDGIITIDSRQRIVMFNQAAERIFGASAEDALGAPIDRFIPERFRQAHERHVQVFGDTGRTMRAMGRPGKLSGLRADGAEFPIEASISQTVVDGEKFYTVILRDISEQKTLEAQLLHAQKMEGIGRLAGGIAHDFNNLVMAVQNNLMLATRRLEPDAPAQTPIAHAREAAERAANLTRQLLAFSRKQSVRPRVLNPREVVENMEAMLRRLIGSHITLETELDPQTWDVHIDGPQLEQVLMNLVVNARDAMPDGGTITIQAGNVAPGGRASLAGEHVRIAVLDTGSGMDSETLARAFEPFFTTKPPGEGTGLGLATCHGIVHQSGGQISVRSELGRGSTVEVLLPRVEPSSDQHDRAVRGTETVLLVEAGPMVRKVATEALQIAGYQTLTASTAQAALRLAAAHRGQIELLIVGLPDPEGAALIGELQRQRGALAVIALTGPGDPPAGGELGSAAVLRRPFSDDALLRAVRAVLDRRDGRQRAEPR